MRLMFLFEIRKRRVWRKTWDSQLPLLTQATIETYQESMLDDSK